MSRANTPSNIPLVGLQPQARPVDTFSVPNVAPQQGGTELLQIAQALSQVEPKVAQALNSQFAGHVQASEIRARADSAKYQSLKDLRQAVQDGKLNESDNPWYTVQLKQEVARVTASRAIAELRDKYLNSQERWQDDLDPVGKLADSHLSGLLEGADVWETEALNPILQGAKAELLNYHVGVRSKERMEEREQTAKADLADLLSGVDASTLLALDGGRGSDVAQAKLSAAQQGVQNKLNELLTTMSRGQANKIVKETIMEYAALKESPDLARRLMAGLVKEDGTPLGLNSEDRLRMLELDRRVEDLKIHRLENEQRVQQIAERKVADDTLKFLADEAAAAEKAGIPFDWAARISPSALSRLSPEAASRVIQTTVAWSSSRAAIQGSQEKQVRDKALEDYGQRWLTGQLTPDERQTFVGIMMRNGGLGSLQEIASIEDRLANMNWTGATSPEVLGDLATGLADGSLAFEKGGIQRLVKLAGDRQLSQRDFNGFMESMLSRYRREDGQGENTLIASNLDRLDDLIDARAYKDKRFATPHEAAADPTLRGLRGRAKYEYLQAAQQLTRSDSWSKMSLIERQEALSGLMDQVAKNNKGFDRATFDTYMGELEQAEQERLNAALVDVPKPAPPGSDPVIEEARLRNDPVLGSITHTDQSTIQALRTKVGLNSQMDYVPYRVAPDTYKGGTDPTTHAIDMNTAPNPKNKRIDSVLALVNTRLYLNPKRSRMSLVGDSFADPENLFDIGKLSKSQPKAGTVEYLEQAEIEARQDALIEAKSLHHNMLNSGVMKRYRDLLSKGKVSDLSADEASEFKDLDYMVVRLSLLRKHVGYDTDEVKNMGKDAWRSYVLFANRRDIDQRGPAVAKALGLTDLGTIKEFMVEQEKKLSYVRDVRN